MTQLEELEQQIISNIKKIRQQTLKKFLLQIFKPNSKELKVFINPETRRARYDYKLAFNTLLLIFEYQDKEVDFIIEDLLSVDTSKLSEEERERHLKMLELCAKVKGK